jgi:phosphoribosylanthranilate isomerase
MTTAKICGLRTSEAVAAALDGGASHLGFMFFPASPRDIAPEAAAALARPARGRARIVAVVVDPDDALIERLTRVLNPDDFQLHGRESPARLKDLAGKTDAGLIKVLPVSDASDIDRAGDYVGVAHGLMFDARTPATVDRPGGAGVAFDWALLAGRRFERPWFLAGGLDPWNVGEAIALSGAPIVDVSSGVERGAGLKDAVLIGAFLDAVRRA